MKEPEPLDRKNQKTELSDLTPEELFWRPFFIRPKKIILIKRRGNSMKQKLLEMIQVAVWLHTYEFIFV